MQTSSAARSTGKVLAVAVAAGLIATACGGGGGGGSEEASGTSTTTVVNSVTDEGTPVEGGRLTVAVESETPGWNPASNVWTLEGNFIGSTIFEPLTVVNSKGEIVPWLAESVTGNENSTLWTIKLREGITFHDGSPMDAEAVVKSLEYQNSDSALASFVTKPLIGTPVATGEYTIEIPVNVQWGAFPSMLNTPYGYVLGAPMMTEANEFGTANPSGTGAYRFEKWQKDRLFRVTKNEEYWGGPCAVVESPDAAMQTLCDDLGVAVGQKNGPWLDSMEFRPIPDPVQRQQALQAGDVNMILNTRPGVTAATRDSFQVVTDYTSEQNFVQLQTAKPPFDNIHARKALAYATDRVALVEQLGAGEDIPVDTSPFEEEDVWGGLAPEDTNYPLYDPAKAAEELEKYLQDMEGKVDKLSFTLMGVASLDDLEVMQALSEMWAKAGIEANIESIKKEALVGLQVGGDFQAVISRNYSFPDPDAEYIFFHGDFASGDIALNFTRWGSVETDAALDLGRESSDPEFRKEAYDSFVRARNAAAPDIWLFNTPWSMIAEDDVRGLNAFRTLGIAGYVGKPWVQGLWVAPPS